MDFLLAFSLRDYPPDYGMPVFYLLGDQDYQTPTPLAAEYFDTITAPHKALRLLRGAGHLAMLDQPEAFAGALAHIRATL